MRAVWVLLLAAGCSRESEPVSAPPTATPSPASTPAAAEAPQSSGVTVVDQEQPVVVTDEAQLPALVGKLVTLIGTQTRTKQPTVLGVDVDEDYDLADQTVQVTGVLHRRVVERDPNEGKPPGLMVATRGAGTYYSVVDAKTGRLARPVKAP